MEEPENAIIFCNTRDDTALVTAVLNRNGFDAELLNGDLPQKERERVMAQGEARRGAPSWWPPTSPPAASTSRDLAHVINYSLPEDPAVYLHRVGRTGRIGKKGTAHQPRLRTRAGHLHRAGEEVRHQVREAGDALAGGGDAAVDRAPRPGDPAAAAGSVYEGYLGLAGELKQRPDADDPIAFLLKYFFSHLRMEKLKAAGGPMPEPAPARPPRERERSGATGRGARSAASGASEERVPNDVNVYCAGDPPLQRRTE